MSEENKIRDAADAVKGIVEAVPIYEDTIQPAAKEIGKGLCTVAKVVNVALAPVEGLVWGYDKIKDYVHSKVSEKLEKVPQERIETPKPHLAGPALEALRYTGCEEDLREMYANLLANSMDKKTAKEAHPAFVDTIRNLCPDEAKILKHLATSNSFALIDIKSTNKEDRSFRLILRNVSFIGTDSGCEHADLTQNYIDNLVRLGLLEIPWARHINDNSFYERILNAPDIKALKEKLDNVEDHKFEYDKKKAELTDLGRLFVSACVIDKSVKET